MSNSTQLGPLAMNQLQNIEDKIKQTLEQGGKIITGGNRINEFKRFYFEPTIIECNHHNLPAAESELFGPVLSVVNDEDEAVKLMNDNTFGLAAGVLLKTTGLQCEFLKLFKQELFLLILMN